MNVYRRRRTSRIRRLRSRWIPSQNLLITETIDNVGVASQTLYIQAIADSDISSGSATLALIVETTKETEDTSATVTTSLGLDATSDTDSSSASGTQVISDLIPEQDMINVGDGTQIIFEAIAETVSSDATAEHEITETQPGDEADNTGTGTPDISEVIAETITNISNSSQTLLEFAAESLENSTTNIPSLIDFETDAPVNTGTGNHFTDGEKIAEMDTVTFLASLTLDDQRDITVVPFSDISTGTWTVAPLYEKVDELIVASGYPSETIRSGNNPSNDKAILQLSPVSDPGIDDNHFINIEFYKDGSETLDFTVNLKEGSTLIATRTFTDVQETADVPRRERIALTTLEASAIVDYSNLNIELIANQTS